MPAYLDAANQDEELTDEPVLEKGLTTIGEEQKQKGGLAFTVYRSYWRAVGGCMAMSVLLSLFLMQGITEKRHVIVVISTQSR